MPLVLHASAAVEVPVLLWTPDIFDGALDLLLDLPVQRVPSRLLIRGTRRWWPNVTAYDALYLGVAAGWNARVLTCDGPLARAPGLGVAVENVRVT